MNYKKIKSSFKWCILLISFSVSGNAFATVMAISEDLLGEGPGVKYDALLSDKGYYDILFNFPDLSDTSKVYLEFDYGVWTSLVDGKFTINAKLNDSVSLAGVDTFRGYQSHAGNYPGFESASIVINSSDFKVGENKLTFSAIYTGTGTITSEDAAVIGHVNLIYTSVPAPATLFLMLIGMLGIFHLRKKQV